MPRTITARRTATLALIVLLAWSGAGCGSNDSSSSDGAKATSTTTSRTTSKGGTGAATSTTAGPKAGSTPGDTPSTSSSTDPTPTTDLALAYNGPGGRGPCEANPDRLSGTSTVMWTADSASKHKESDATGATTLVFQKDGSMKPAALTVKVGEVFTFGLADGVSDVLSVKVGCDSGQTVLSGPALAAEYITTPGTYDVVNVVADKQVGTITVK